MLPVIPQTKLQFADRTDWPCKDKLDVDLPAYLQGRQFISCASCSYQSFVVALDAVISTLDFGFVWINHIYAWDVQSAPAKCLLLGKPVQKTALPNFICAYDEIIYNDSTKQILVSLDQIYAVFTPIKQCSQCHLKKEHQHQQNTTKWNIKPQHH